MKATIVHQPAGPETCQECQKAEKHAYSDATTAGFFSPLCDKHRAEAREAAEREACPACRAQRLHTDAEWRNHPNAQGVKTDG